MAQKIYSVLATIVGLVLLGAWLSSLWSTREYNSYVDRIRPIIAAQDKIIEELQSTKDGAQFEQAPGWIQRSDAIRQRFAAIKPREQEIQEMHQKWIERSDCITKALRALQRYGKSLAQQDLDSFRRLLKASTDHVKQFETLRDAYFKSHDMELRRLKSVLPGTLLESGPFPAVAAEARWKYALALFVAVLCGVVWWSIRGPKERARAPIREGSRAEGKKKPADNPAPTDRKRLDPQRDGKAAAQLARITAALQRSDTLEKLEQQRAALTRLLGLYSDTEAARSARTRLDALVKELARARNEAEELQGLEKNLVLLLDAHRYSAAIELGWANPKAVRYPMGRGAVPLCSLWKGLRLGYIQARKTIYAPLYADAVQRTAAWSRLKELYDHTQHLVLLDFDGYDHRSLGRSLTDVLNDPSRRMGHAFVLAMLLTQDRALGELELRS